MLSFREMQGTPEKKNLFYFAIVFPNPLKNSDKL